MNIAQSIAATALVLLARGDSWAADEKPAPAAPTISDAHEYVESVVSRNGISGLYTARMDGTVIGYIVYPVRRYSGADCHSALVLSNGDKIDIDWTVVGKLQVSDGQIGIWRSPNVVYENARILSIEGGVAVEPARNIPTFNLAINDELSRNRLLKAMELLSSSCRSTSKFD